MFANVQDNYNKMMRGEEVIYEDIHQDEEVVKKP
jgi:hypothetical protein|tara:strand:+ start:1181 stop:1282 length:102 start_codon:yes stop_codon:yes gene_type:complete